MYDIYTGRLDPMEAWDLVVNLPPGARLWRILGGPMSWTPMEYWTAGVVDLLASANWQRTDDGQKGINHPRPVPRPEVDVTRSATKDAKSVAFDRAATFRARQAAAQEATATEG